jgi:hypothetical protein
MKMQAIDTVKLTPLVGKANEKVMKKFHLKPSASGTFGPYKGFTFLYHSYEKMNIDQGRNLIINLIADFVSQVNQNIQNKGFDDLESFHHLNIQIMIFFKDSNEKFQSATDALAVVSGGGDNRVTYSKFDTTIDDFVKILEESYESAYQKVKGTTPECK